MKTRRIIASALAFIMATTAAASSVFAAGETVKISASKAEAEAGAAFTIDISLSGVPSTAIKGCEFAIKYDASALSITGVEAGEITNTGADSAESDISGECPAFFEDHSTAGTITLTWCTGLSDKGYWISKDGVFATISGTVAAGATAGEYPIEIIPIPREDISGTNNTIYVGYVDNGTAVEYGTSVANGAVVVAGKTESTTSTTSTTTTTTTPIESTTTTTTTVTTGNDQPGSSTTTTSKTQPTTTTTTATTGSDQPGSSTTTKTPVGSVLYGDLNLDETVSMVDVVYLNKFNAGIIKFNDQQTANADCVFDGKIDSSDSMALLKYMVNKVTSLPLQG
ncbi:MAG: cohesin domain-containing protein [Ruminococcus sp.]